MFRFVSSLCLFLLLAALVVAPAHAMSEPEEVVEKAKVAAEGMFSDPNFPLLLDLTTKAKAILIVPNMVRLGFIIGGRGGNAVLLTRDGTGSWSAPAFYTVGGVSWGLQIGAQSSQLIIVIMSEKGLRAVMDRKVTLGADANIAVGELGAGAQASTGLDLKADMYAFSRSSGAFAGVALDGTVITPRQSFNDAFYGVGTSPQTILLDRMASNPKAQSLLDVMPR